MTSTTRCSGDSRLRARCTRFLLLGLLQGVPGPIRLRQIGRLDGLLAVAARDSMLR